MKVWISVNLTFEFHNAASQRWIINHRNYRHVSSVKIALLSPNAFLISSSKINIKVSISPNEGVVRKKDNYRYKAKMKGKERGSNIRSSRDG